MNDDGILAPGIRLVAEILQGLGEVKVVAPFTERSGVSHGITVHEPLRLRFHEDFLPRVQAWSLDAKPADCVKFALYGLKLPIDLVVSGINNGPNLGTDISYSGTLGGASEGIICGVPAMSVSTDYEGWELPRNELKPLVEKIFASGLLSPEYVINLNFPRKKYAQSKGIKVTDMGFRSYLQGFEEDTDSPGIFWAQRNLELAENSPGTDVWAYENGYVSVTPIQVNRTATGALSRFREVLGGQDHG